MRRQHGFRERVILPVGEEQEAELVEHTQLARLFATAIDVLEQARPPFLIWVHAQAMQGPWDAPYDLRCRFAEEEDPDPPRSAVPPDCWLTADYDPDELLGYQHAYAGQVSLLDTCLSILLDALWSGSVGESTRRCWRLPRAATRWVNTAMWDVLSDRCTPNCCKFPGCSIARRAREPHGDAHQLVQPPDVYPTLLEWFDVALPDAAAVGTWCPAPHAGTRKSCRARTGRQPGRQRACDTGACLVPAARRDRPSRCCMPNPTIAGNSMRYPTAARKWPASCPMCFSRSKPPHGPTIASVSRRSPDVLREGLA